MNTNKDYLRRIDGEIYSLECWHPESSRLSHLREVIRPDIVSRMSEQEIQDYESSKYISPEEKAKREQEDLARMAMNKDSNSI